MRKTFTLFLFCSFFSVNLHLPFFHSQHSTLSAATFKNPIIAEDAPDPSIIKGNDGYYYLFSTAEHVYRSTDMVNWKYLRQVFDGGKRPTFVEGVNVYWAPCVTKQDGRYVLYFALSKWGGGDTASIGVATATKPEGPYTIVGEEGKLFTSGEIGVNNSIDPNYIEDNGRKYIVWGSWNGIWLIELTEDGLAVKNIRRKRQIAGTRFEAPYIYKRGKFYYLFCSIGACCEGARSTYETVVGRATSLFGPYFAKNGGKMLDNDCTIFLTSNEPCIAPGHNSRIIEDETGKTWMTYHGYLRSDPDRGRVAWLDEVKWGEDGWPYIEGNGASATELEAPVVTPFSHDVDEIHAEWGVEQGTLLPVDLLNQGQMDLVVAGTRTDQKGLVMPWNTLLRKNNEGQWAATTASWQAGLKPSVVPADFDGDGSLELLLLGQPHETLNPDGAANGVYRVQPDNTLLLESEALADLTAATVADVNSDGFPDIIGVGPQGRNVVLYAQAPATPPFVFRSGSFAGKDKTFEQVLSADFNADGHPDIFAYSASEAELFLYDPATGDFVPTGWATSCPVPTDGGVAVADVDYDSTLDIVCVGTQGVVCFNDGTGHFTPSTATGLDVDYQNAFCSVSAANLFDWDGDNYADFLYQGQNPALNTATGAIWIGTGKGAFNLRRRYGSGLAATTAFLDWNDDGAPDLITTGSMTDDHLFHNATGCLLAVSLNPNRATRSLQALSNLESRVEGNNVYLTWQRGLKNQTYEVFVRDAAGRLYGNVRSYVDGEWAGRRKVMAHGNCGTATEVVLTLPAGEYTWGVQRISPRLGASPFATAMFTVEADGISDLPTAAGRAAAHTQHFNTIGQRVPSSFVGMQLLRYPDGSIRKVMMQ